MNLEMALYWDSYERRFYVLTNDYRQKIDSLDLGENQNIVGNLIDQIEQDVNEIRDELAKYTNLTEINEIYEMAKYLSTRLF